MMDSNCNKKEDIRLKYNETFINIYNETFILFYKC